MFTILPPASCVVPAVIPCPLDCPLLAVVVTEVVLLAVPDTEFSVAPVVLEAVDVDVLEDVAPVVLVAVAPVS